MNPDTLKAESVNDIDVNAYRIWATRQVCKILLVAFCYSHIAPLPTRACAVTCSIHRFP